MGRRDDPRRRCELEKTLKDQRKEGLLPRLIEWVRGLIAG